jgi:acyl carrier protein
VLRTPFLTRGYVNAPEDQHQRFIPTPFRGDPGDVLYRTGDLGRYAPDGTVMVLGRLDQQIKIRGVRIEPEEVTAVLSRHPQVRACAVVGRTVEAGAMTLVAYLVSRDDGVSQAALRSYLAEHLPPALVPSAFVFLDDLPLTANGKLDHRALPAPTPAVARPEADREAPRSRLEEVLATMWCEVLGVPGVGIHDDFFSLGGHSLMATRVIARVRNALGLELPLRTFFEAPTVSGLAAVIAVHLDAARRDGGATVGMDRGWPSRGLV